MTIVKCYACEGEDAHCAMCAGLGVIRDSGPGEPETAGQVARRRCGCAVDFLADAADPTFRAIHLAAWDRQGFTRQPMKYGAAAELIAKGQWCSH